MAAIMATQAAAQQNALRYSREAESEADRIGIANLAAAGYSPLDMQDMFSIMQRQTSSFGTAVPEYLRTHPMSDRRASDAALRAQQYPPIIEPDRSYYRFMRARAFTISTPNPRSLIAKFERQITSNSVDAEAARYGLALVYSKDNEYDKALTLLNQLTRPSELEVVIDLAYVEILRDQSRFEEAQALIDPLIDRHADQFPVSYANAQNLYDLRRFQQAIIELEALSESNPENSEVWFMLAETYGLAGDLVGVHKARAEWYTLNGAFSQAVRQLGFARDLMNQQGYHVIDISRTEERMRQIRELQVESDRL
jgi:predicted Zn-dependent protease